MRFEFDEMRFEFDELELREEQTPVQVRTKANRRGSWLGHVAVCPARVGCAYCCCSSRLLPHSLGHVPLQLNQPARLVEGQQSAGVEPSGHGLGFAPPPA